MTAVAWAPQPGSQQAFLACPVFEVLLEGERGGGKTDCLLMDFAQHCGKGLGADWRGVLFRRTFPELGDVIAKSRKWFAQIFPNAVFNISNSTWTWPTGEQLLLRPFERTDDYWKYHGHAYPWQGWEELTNWATLDGYKMMFSCCRSTNPNAPRKIRATTNPHGIGHNVVKARWRLPGSRWKVITDSYDETGNLEPPRVAIPSRLSENRILLSADPDYKQRMLSAATSESMRAAWGEGDWEVTAGGMFDDLWSRPVHVIPYFPSHLIPGGWRVDRSLDWGSAKPFSVGWWLESDGTPLELPGGRVIGEVDGDLIRYNEWYGCAEKPNTGLQMVAREVAQGIIEREEGMSIRGRVRPGPADHNIFSDEAGDDDARVMARAGVRWVKASKGPGSRKKGWEAIRGRLEAQTQPMPRSPGLVVTERCEKFISILPVAPRSDYDPDDVDTDSEDHIPDEVRYRVHKVKSTVKRGSW